MILTSRHSHLYWFIHLRYSFTSGTLSFNDQAKKVLHYVFFTCFETFLCTYDNVFLMSPECIPMVFSYSRQFWCTKSLYSITKHGCPNIFLSHIKLLAWVFVWCVFSWDFNICDQMVHFSANLDIKHQYYTKTIEKR